ncbi:hypothetical protein [Paenibacillus rhizoplanae]|uniref:Uncharacterized protein n=1 Tax=Paenibacillus rhizoplanae TaxID=1917181 RepID=A0ABW5FH79_9BACL
MFIYGNKEVQIIEYDCVSVRKKYANLQRVNNNENKLVISSVRLSVAMARTILSKDPTNIDLFFQSLSSFFNIQSIVDSRGGNLCLSTNISGKYRDFSLTGRIGELAQAINYLFVQDFLNYPLVVDFDGYISRFPSTACYKGRAPDFIISQFGSTVVSILESKGSHPKNYGSNLKAVLKDGLEQCENARQFISSNNIPINVHRTFASGVWFSSSNRTWDTTIGFSDPIEEKVTKNFDDQKLLRYHYASWFSMLGLFDYSLQLISDEVLTLEKPLETFVHNDETYLIIDLKYLKYYYLSFYLHPYSFYRNIKFGISEKIWRLLTANNLEGLRMEFNFTSFSGEGIEVFSDGTLVLHNEY